MDPFEQAERRAHPTVAAPETWVELRRRYYHLKALWHERLWESPDGKLLESEIRTERITRGPQNPLANVVFATPRTLALYWDILNECEVGFSNILIIGERGTGKEELTRVIAHALSKELVPVNCATLVENVADAQLFGVQGGQGISNVGPKGSEGYVHEARGKVLFLDELFDAPKSVLPKLLRLLQQRRFARVGGREEALEDTEIIAASNRYPDRNALNHARYTGDVRADFVDRFPAILELPRLRDRRDEIPFLTEHLLSRIRGELTKHPQKFPFRRLSEDSCRRLEQLDHAWPGNIRELQDFLRAQGMLRRHATKDEVLEIPQEALSNWVAGNRPSAEKPSTRRDVSLSAWSSEGMRLIREQQLLDVLRDELRQEALSPAQADAGWVTRTVRKKLGIHNVSQKLKDALGKGAGDIARLLQG